MIDFIRLPGRETVAVVDGTLPSRSDWAMIRAENAVINVVRMPGGSSSLEALLPWRDEITRLSVNSASCRDLRAIGQFPRLRSLAVGGLVSQRPSVHDLSVEEFAGDPDSWPDIGALPTLRRLRIVWRASAVPTLNPELRELTMTDAVGLTSLIELKHLSKLTTLRIHGARDLDLLGLQQLSSLEVLQLESVRRLRSTALIAQLPNLEELQLHDVPIIEDWEALLEARGTIRVSGRHPFTKQSLPAPPGNWILPQRGR